MKKVYLRPELEISIFEEEMSILAGSDESRDINTPEGPLTGLEGGITDDSDEEPEGGSCAKGGGYVAWGMSWDDEF